MKTIKLLLVAIVVCEIVSLLKEYVPVTAPEAPRTMYLILGPKDLNLQFFLVYAGYHRLQIASSRRAVSDGDGIYELMLSRQYTNADAPSIAEQAKWLSDCSRDLDKCKMPEGLKTEAFK
jgi:hypothetical protein